MGGIVSAVVKPVTSVIGSLTGADDTRDAANIASAQQSAAAREAARLSMFRPIGITNRLGSSQFGFDKSGKLKSGSYTLSPELKQIQDYVFGLTGGAQGDTSSLLSLGRQYLATSPEEAASQYIQQQRGLLAPQRETQLGQVRSNLMRTGRGGLAVGQGTGRGAANPELQAYYNAIAQQEGQLASQADQYGRQRLAFGQGLLSSAYSPLQTNLGMIGSIEELGQSPFKLGLQAGGAAQQGSSTAAQLLGSGLSSAAQTRYQGEQAANASNSQFLSSLIGSAAMAGAGGFGGGSMGGFFNTNSTASPFFNTGANVFSPNYFGGTSFGE
jgi:hypothetical protein